MVEEIPPFDGRISPVRWKDFLPYGGRISRPIVEENRGTWKVFPTHRGRISPSMVEGFPLRRAARHAWPPKTRLCVPFLCICDTFRFPAVTKKSPRRWMVEGFTPCQRASSRTMVEGIPPERPRPLRPVCMVCMVCRKRSVLLGLSGVNTVTSSRTVPLFDHGGRISPHSECGWPWWKDFPPYPRQNHRHGGRISPPPV
jgi:hypothetical protein